MNPSCWKQNQSTAASGAPLWAAVNRCPAAAWRCCGRGPCAAHQTRPWRPKLKSHSSLWKQKRFQFKSVFNPGLSFAWFYVVTQSHLTPLHWGFFPISMTFCQNNLTSSSFSKICLKNLIIASRYQNRFLIVKSLEFFDWNIEILLPPPPVPWVFC